MSKIIDVDYRTVEEKVDDFKWKCKSTIKNFGRWCADNKELLITVVPVVVGGAATVSRVVGRRVNLHKQESIKNLYCYDRSLGHYWRLRRELSNTEWLEIDQRKKNGEKLGDILSELKVLK